MSQAWRTSPPQSRRRRWRWDDHLAKSSYYMQRLQLPVISQAEKDIEFYKRQPVDESSPRIPNGTGAFMVTLAPAVETPSHRTSTIDLDVVIQGEIECELDDGEARRLKPGQSIIQRGTMHKWRNISPDGGWAKLLVVAQDLKTVETERSRQRNVMRRSIKIIYGTESFSHINKEEAARLLRVAKSFGVDELDTAHLYANSEKVLGSLDAGRTFTFHTKAPGVFPGSMRKKKVLAGMEQSLDELQVSEVETYFLHAADSGTPLTETLEAIQELYDDGKFKQFGVSNLSTEQLGELLDLCGSKGYVLPSIYQGNYNPVARHMEADLLPLVRKHKMKFYAYSPLAGGFLAKTTVAIQNDTSGGRWDKRTPVGSMYHKLYNRPNLIEGLRRWDDIANNAGTTRAELAYRWMTYHSALEAERGDAMIIGARHAEQLGEALTWLRRGPLDKRILPEIEAIWTLVQSEVHKTAWSRRSRLANL